MTLGEKHREATVEAVNLATTPPSMSPREAWKKAIAKKFDGASEKTIKEYQVKCASGTFLGLCEDGYVEGIDPATAGTYTRSKKNKRYGINAAEALLRGESQYSNLDGEILVERLRERFLPTKQDNQQMDIVVALWNANKLRKPQGKLA